MSALPTAAERAAVDGHLGLPQSAWEGGEERPEDAVLAEGGFRASQDRRQHILPTLHAVNDAIGWVSAGALNYICQRLLVPPAEAYGVAGFYALLSLEERPARVAHICDDVACRNQGGNKILSDLEGRSDVHPSPCLGQCDQAPAVFYQRAGEADCVAVVTDTDQVIKVLEGGKPEEVPATVPQAGDPALRLLKRIGRVDPTSLEDYRRAGGYRALTKAIDLGADQVLSEIKASNLRGRGGAAFPMGIKWEAVARSSVTLRYLICNADESEPGTFKDRVIMEGDPFALIESMTIAGLAIGAELGYLYIRAEYPFAQSLLENAIEQTRESGLLGDDVDGSGKSFDIEIRRGGGAYICGEETALMNSIEGLRGEPRNKPPFPTDSGLFGKPTVINNVETLCNVLDIVTDGGNSFASSGTPQSTGPKLFCLSGSVRRPGTYEVEFGATLGDLIALAGGLPEGRRLRAVLLGGAAGSFVLPDLLEMPLTFEAASEAGISLGSGVIMAFDQHTDFGDILARIAAFFRDETCGQCVPCRVGTVRVEEALARIRRDPQPGDSKLIEEIDLAMRDASICGLGHTAAIALRSALELGLLE